MQFQVTMISRSNAGVSDQTITASLTAHNDPCVLVWPVSHVMLSQKRDVTCNVVTKTRVRLASEELVTRNVGAIVMTYAPRR